MLLSQIFRCLGEDFYQTYARTRVCAVFFFVFFGAFSQENQQKISRKGLFFWRESQVARNSGDSPL